jgi:hypothetical protein
LSIDAGVNFAKSIFLTGASLEIFWNIPTQGDGHFLGTPVPEWESAG